MPIRRLERQSTPQQRPLRAQAPLTNSAHTMGSGKGEGAFRGEQWDVLGPTHRRRDLKRGRKCPRKALPSPPPPEPPRPVPIPVEISAMIGVSFSDQNGNGLSNPPRDADVAIYLLQVLQERGCEKTEGWQWPGCARGPPSTGQPALLVRLSAPAPGCILDFILHGSI